MRRLVEVVCSSCGYQGVEEVAFMNGMWGDEFYVETVPECPLCFEKVYVDEIVDNRPTER